MRFATVGGASAADADACFSNLKAGCGAPGLRRIEAWAQERRAIARRKDDICVGRAEEWCLV